LLVSEGNGRASAVDAVIDYGDVAGRAVAGHLLMAFVISGGKKRWYFYFYDTAPVLLRMNHAM
jgi:hypothetical protein